VVERKKMSKFRFEYNINFLTIKIISNTKCMHYKVIAPNKIYNFRIAFICIQVRAKEM
jgi:hypothetical protein